MNSLLLVSSLAAGFLATAAPPKTQSPAPTLRRLALVAGANRGFADRAPLRYAVRDAERFGAVLTAMGGVAAADANVLREPTKRDFMTALGALGARAVEAKGASSRVEAVVYFSGHADERGLMFGAERVPYEDLRAAIRSMPVDVGIGILDACASGAITRLKGGTAHPAFLSDSTMNVQGYAFLASSSEGEAAQESDRLGGSYFTHALMTGLRGAADTSGDGRVTLGEAYQFAFNETLAQTTTSQAGAQHPSYDIKMAGTGDVVMTDVRQTSASLILAPTYRGRFYVIDEARHLVAELQKGEGRAVELGLEPGHYRIYFEEGERLSSTSMKLVEGQRQELVRGTLRTTKRLPTLRRGGVGEGDLLAKRSRIEGGFGLGSDIVDSPAFGSMIGDAPVVFSFLHWMRPSMALEITMMDRGRIEASRFGSFVGSERSMMAGARYYPRAEGSLRPLGLAGIGVFDDSGIESGVSGKGISAGGQMGVGVDLYLKRRLTVSISGVVTAAVGREAHFDLRVGTGWNWGGTRRR